MRKPVYVVLIVGVALAVYMAAHLRSNGAGAASKGRWSITTTSDSERVTPVRLPGPVATPGSAASSIPSGSANTDRGQTAVIARAGTHADIHPAIDLAVDGGNGRQTVPQKVQRRIPHRAAPTEAVIVEEVDGTGVVIYKTDPDAADSNDRAASLRDIVENDNRVASSRLLQLFEQAKDVDDKNEILSSATQIPSDKNTRALLEAALSKSQPKELRMDAVIYAADQQPDLLLRYTDDPVVGVEVKSVSSAAGYPETPVVNGADSHPPLGKTSRPPPDANQAASRQGNQWYGTK